ncbi:MAG: hypothetical protein ACLQLG_18585 [Thermoguttaceae bacterium]
MHEFKDGKNRTWRLEVNCETIALAKAECDVNVVDLADSESDLAKEVTEYPPLLAKIGFAMLKDQAETAEVEPVEFARSLNGDGWEALFDAMLDEIVLFSRRHRRPLLQAVLGQQRQAEETASKLVLEQIQDQRVRQQLLAAMEDQIRSQIQAALARLREGPAGGATAAAVVEKSPSATPSSTGAGSPPDSCASPGPAATPGDSSSASPPAPGSPIPG